MEEKSSAETSVAVYHYTWRHLPGGLNLYICDCIVSELSIIYLESEYSGIPTPGAVTVLRIFKAVGIGGRVELNAYIHLASRLRLSNEDRFISFLMHVLSHISGNPVWVNHLLTFQSLTTYTVKPA